MLAILLIPAALCFTYGRMIGSERQGVAILAAMLMLFAGGFALAAWAEHQASPALSGLGVDSTAGSWEGKELRVGIIGSALWATATTAASNGSVNGMHDSMTPLGGLAAMFLILLGEVAFGGVGCGLYGMIVFVVVAVFLAGLMVGRTPEYLGKKLGVQEMRMAAIVILIPPLLVLSGAALAVAIPAGRDAVLNPGPHGFSEVLYAFASAGNNNGSAFAGLASNTSFYNLVMGFVMLVARFALIVPVLALAGSLGRQNKVPAGPGTLPTDTPLFVGWLVAVVIAVGALSFLPALALGPIAEQLSLAR